MTQNVSEYFQKLYRKNKIKKKQASHILFKRNILDDQFEYFQKSLNDKY